MLWSPEENGWVASVKPALLSTSWENKAISITGALSNAGAASLSSDCNPLVTISNLMDVPAGSEHIVGANTMLEVMNITENATTLYTIGGDDGLIIIIPTLSFYFY